VLATCLRHLTSKAVRKPIYESTQPNNVYGCQCQAMNFDVYWINNKTSISLQLESHNSLQVLRCLWLHNLTQQVEPASTLQSDVFSSIPITQFTNSKNSTAAKLIKTVLIDDWNGGEFHKIMAALVILLNSPPNQTCS